MGCGWLAFRGVLGLDRFCAGAESPKDSARSVPKSVGWR